MHLSCQRDAGCPSGQRERFLIFSVDFTCVAGLKNLEDVIQYFHKGKGKTIEE